VWIGALAGFAAACAYDVFRLPFVFARPWHIDSIVPALPLFKVFPRFGMTILGPTGMSRSFLITGPVTAAVVYHPNIWAHLVGWAYHFSNGMSVGVMYLAMIGVRNATRRTWMWGIVMAVGIEIALLATPYATTFGIPVTSKFIAVTLAAHMIFGAVMGLMVLRFSRPIGSRLG
jgi:hypothetical protein